MIGPTSTTHTRGLQPGVRFEFVQKRSHQEGSFLDLLPWRAFVRVEVEDDTVGSVDVPGEPVPGMELQDVHLVAGDQGWRIWSPQELGVAAGPKDQ